jgi:hypothetical protein
MFEIEVCTIQGGSRASTIAKIVSLVYQQQYFLIVTQQLLEILSAMTGSNQESFGCHRAWIVCGRPSSDPWRIGTPDQ